MPRLLNAEGAVALAKKMLAWRKAEAAALNAIYTYVRGKQSLPIVPAGTPREIRALAKMSRVNMIPLAIGVPAQALYVDGYKKDGDDDESWGAWQANKLDSTQTGVHRAGLGYGAAYVRVTPAEPRPLIKGVSPRNMTAVYGDDDVWPIWALECIPLSRRSTLWRLYDDVGVYFLDGNKEEEFTLSSRKKHGFKVTPVVRFRNVHDLDDDHIGEVTPLMPIQDQIDFTTFGLLVAQHFQSFKQRYIVGWTTDDENEKLKASASRLWTFANEEGGSEGVKVGEFDQVNLQGFLESRSASQEHLATLSQVPPQHLLGKLVNLSGEALVAANDGKNAKTDERKTNFGEAWEQVFHLTALAEGREVDDTAQVRWRDTEARAFAATVDGLGKLAEMLKVPVEMLWERIPDWTQQDTERAKDILTQAAAAGTSVEALLRSIDDKLGGTEDVE